MLLLHLRGPRSGLIGGEGCVGGKTFLFLSAVLVWVRRSLKFERVGLEVIE